MPLCTTCAQPLPYLYTVYHSANNIRLEQCPSCLQIADPYVEHYGGHRLRVLTDLIWLKRDVYRHLLFNRGAPPRRVDARSRTIRHARVKDKESDDESSDSVGSGKGQKVWDAEKERWGLIARLGMFLVLVDAFIRWSKLGTSSFQRPWRLESNADVALQFMRVLLGCFIETVAFHAGITFSSFVVLTSLDWVSARLNRPKAPPSGVRQQLRYSHIPLCLLYSSLTKSFLLFLLSIWPPLRDPYPPHPRDYIYTLHVENPILQTIWEAFDDDKLDREWVVRNVLGGMSAGFGLRVVLDCHPVFTTVVILAGWGIKTAVAGVVSGWVGADEESVGEVWLAYSIP
ncbi:Arv1-domain-containing protein [Dentipellis sp. KUC8613]|nr:Arv1-domain-containing protein [Dentipellis sp. KUC8613]